MTEILNKIITSEHLVWGKTLTDKKQKFVVVLNSEIIHELIERRNELMKEVILLEINKAKELNLIIERL